MSHLIICDLRGLHPSTLNPRLLTLSWRTYFVCDKSTTRVFFGSELVTRYIGTLFLREHTGFRYFYLLLFVLFLQK